jgi:hypothetical protein
MLYFIGEIYELTLSGRKREGEKERKRDGGMERWRDGEMERKQRKWNGNRHVIIA